MYSTLSRRLMKRIGKPLMVTAYTTLWGMLFLLPMSLTSDWGAVSALTTNQWGSILYLAVVCSSGGYFLWNYALSKTGGGQGIGVALPRAGRRLHWFVRSLRAWSLRRSRCSVGRPY